MNSFVSTHFQIPPPPSPNAPCTSPTLHRNWYLELTTKKRYDQQNTCNVILCYLKKNGF